MPNLYIPYQNATPRAVDEYTLSQALGDQLEDVMINHYETFITEQDFAQIAAAGMNWIRLPVPFWAVETVEDEPYLEGHAWNYMLQAFGEQELYSERSPSSSDGVCSTFSQNGPESTVFESSSTCTLFRARRTA